ncbi:hypothetical protein GE21DRAFT_1306147 [Neurospora crassa]|nr:hypothetical protein GE21DRAFT_1306147 [Neurospora crassa]
MSPCLLAEPGVLLLLLQVLHQGFVRCGRAHATPPSICTFLRPSTVLTMPACIRLLFGCRIDVETRWQITLGHFQGTAQASQPAHHARSIIAPIFHKTFRDRNPPCPRIPLILGPNRHHLAQRAGRRCGYYTTKCRVCTTVHARW